VDDAVETIPDRTPPPKAFREVFAVTRAARPEQAGLEQPRVSRFPFQIAEFKDELRGGGAVKGAIAPPSPTGQRES